MRIHWFPGHMTKAIRMMREEAKNVDSVIYVLDSRAPRSCLNDSFEEVIRGKTRLYVLNKADLVARTEVLKWAEYFAGLGMECIYTDSLSKKDSASIVKKLLKVNAGVIERYRAKGVRKTVRAMVIGVPNSGKSTLINSLAPVKRAVTGNRPGVTRGKQWVSIGAGVELLDSPGVLYPDFSDEEKALRLTLIGSVRDEVVDITELAREGYKLFSKIFPEALEERYGELHENADGALEAIAVKRGLMLKGGVPDVERAAKTLITDYRKGYLGKKPLEEPK